VREIALGHEPELPVAFDRGDRITLPLLYVLSGPGKPNRTRPGWPTHIPTTAAPVRLPTDLLLSDESQAAR
jgi:hypothetical protein